MEKRKKLKTRTNIRKVAILAGGWSGEREISLRSGKKMLEVLQESWKYDVCLIDVEHNLLKFVKDIEAAAPDVLLLALHGVGGEDGLIQGVLEMLTLPYTHSDVLSSALAMDKVYSRIIFEHFGIKGPQWGVFSQEDLLAGSHDFRFPYVLKPRNEGSSLGVCIVKSQDILENALKNWAYCPDILVEEYIPGKDIMTGVYEGRSLGTIEIRPHSEFLNYDSKYTQGESEHIMPAEIPQDVYDWVGKQAERAYKALGCRGIARLDFIYGRDEVYLLELNTQPGMTPTSFYPDIARHAGLSYFDVLEQMLESALLSRPLTFTENVCHNKIDLL
ncbi:D-alanine--D-alanine ligase [Alphaproteobacteria bacterium]|nr:D-alanine--D-alanine ligase [Alphaproteobacteria bacterium]GHS98101.1 D-alanine--D-alanine ligase [Alphaproteobacteria bacterium]